MFAIAGDGYVPEPDAVRIEEMINYFELRLCRRRTCRDAVQADGAGLPHALEPEDAARPDRHQGLCAAGNAEDKPSNLVFLLDTSGSMDEPDKLPLLKRAFGLLVDQLRANDTVSIVAYAGSAGVVLSRPRRPTRRRSSPRSTTCGRRFDGGRRGHRARLSAGRAAQGGWRREPRDPRHRWRFQRRHRRSGGPGRLHQEQARQRRVPVGARLRAGNYGDDTMQALAQNGNGNASYIDSFKEAQKVLVAEAAARSRPSPRT
jgi:Ca-activated chloride channel family protein